MPLKFSRRRVALASSVLALACVLALAGGCGYHVAGRAAHLPSNWHTIGVPAFVNRTPTYRIEQRVTDSVVHELLVRTKYRVVPRARGADAVLRGEITDIRAVPLLFDATSGHVTTMLVTLKMKVSLVDQSTNETVYRNDNFVFRDEYQISNDVSTFFQEGDPAMDRMSRAFAADLVSALLEDF